MQTARGTGTSVGQSFDHQIYLAAQRFAQWDARDAELIGKLPLGGQLLERLAADHRQVPRDARAQPPRIDGVLVHDPRDDLVRRVTVEGAHEGQRLVQRRAQAEDIRASIELAAARCGALRLTAGYS